MGKEQTGQCVPGTERNRQVLPGGDEVGELDRRLDSDYDTVRPVVTHHPGINFIKARKALSLCRFCPVAQHALDQTSLILPRGLKVGLWHFQHVTNLRAGCKRNLTAPLSASHEESRPRPVSA